MATKRARYSKRLFGRMAGVVLDVGCGRRKQKGAVGMDVLPLPSVDIVHDIQRFPWPVPSSVCARVIMSHIWEHVEPRHRTRLMEELWRIIRHDGQLFIASPYSHSFLADAHPEHYGCPNEATFQFYDPDYPLFMSGSYGRVKPWKIVTCSTNLNGCLEVILEPRKTEKGKPWYPKRAAYATSAEQQS